MRIVDHCLGFVHRWAAVARKLKPSDSLWKAYWRSRSSVDRDRLIDFYRHLADGTAFGVWKRMPRVVHVGELQSAAMEGLWQAVEKFDAANGAKFETFAAYRIRGAIFDWLRLESGRSRSILEANRIISELDAEYFAVNGHSQNVAEKVAAGADRLGSHVVKRALSPEGNAVISFSTAGSRDDAASIESRFGRMKVPSIPDRSDQAIGLQWMARFLFMGLNASQREVWQLHLVDGRTMSDVGKHMGFSESRISQILKDALTHIRGRFTESEVRELLS